MFRDKPESSAFYRRDGFVPDGATCTEEHFPDLVESKWSADRAGIGAGGSRLAHR